MLNFDNVPIVDIHKENFTQLWPSLLLAIKASSFIAIDTELSGLGNRRALQAKSVEDRYRAISEAAKSRSIISLGLSCFKLNSSTDESKKIWKYIVQTFNITTLCSEEFIVEPLAIQFLVNHGFDFNKQYAQGIPYYKGNDKADDVLEPTLRQLFTEILLSGKTLVFHNAFVDLVFLYQCWYANLPPLLSTFLADIYEAFPGGIYDTKYVAEYLAHTNASYLEYIFKKTQRDNIQKASKNLPHVSIQFLDYNYHYSYIEYRYLSIATPGLKKLTASQICMSYANYGWCPNGSKCPLSHNVDYILDIETKPSKKRRWNHNTNNNDENAISEYSSQIRNDSSISILKPDMDKSANSIESLSSESSTDLPEVSKSMPVLSTKCHKNEESDDFIPQTKKIRIEDVTSEEMSNKINYGGDEPNNTISYVSNQRSDGLVTFTAAPINHPFPEKNDDNMSLIKKSLSAEMNISNENLTSDQSDLKLKCEHKSSSHRAGCDAFMTGFTMATFLASFGKHPGESFLFSPMHTSTVELHNKIYLSGKDVPLIVQKSAFTSSSKFHQEKLLRLQRLISMKSF